jgi:hypothetical protein
MKSTHAAVLSTLNKSNFRESNVWLHCNATTTSSHAALPFTFNLLAYAVQTLHMLLRLFPQITSHVPIDTVEV